jgi:hypothetical protein
MTISKTVSALSSSEIVLELKVIKAVFEPPFQAIKSYSDSQRRLHVTD